MSKPKQHPKQPLIYGRADKHCVRFTRHGEAVTALLVDHSIRFVISSKDTRYKDVPMDSSDNPSQIRTALMSNEGWIQADESILETYTGGLYCDTDRLTIRTAVRFKAKEAPPMFSDLIVSKDDVVFKRKGLWVAGYMKTHTAASGEKSERLVFVICLSRYNYIETTVHPIDSDSVARALSTIDGWANCIPEDFFTVGKPLSAETKAILVATII